ncbi:MAG: vitamin B12 receptor [Bacteroidetes bacterium]|nr:MAG: vitamin B12 receptor [Bacteroidota bacterium]
MSIRSLKTLKHNYMKVYLLKFMKNEFHFNKWSRKNYSVLLSLKKIIKISVLSVSYFIMNAFSTQAQTDTVKIEEVMVKAARTELKYSEASRIIIIIDREEISSVPATGINDILSSVLSIDIRSRGAFGVQADMNIRGGSFEQALVLINGMRVNDSQTGHFNLNLPVDIHDIDRIEVLEGSGARVYGNNAFSGAVNIITNTKDQNNIHFSLMGGSYELFGAKLSSNYTIKKFNNYISLSKKKSDGYKENTDFDILNFYYSGGQTTNSGEFAIQAGFLDKSFGANSFYTPVYPNQYEQNKTAFAGARYNSKGKVNMNYSAYWRLNFDRFELFRDNPANWYTGPNYHTNNLYGVAVNSNIETNLGKASLGLDWNLESILSNKLGNPLDNEKPILGVENKFYTNGSNRQNVSIFVDQQIQRNKFNISAGLMANWNSSFGWNFYPGVDLSYLVIKHLSLMVSANMSGRLPSFTDLYYVGPTNIGNKDLFVEKALTYELGTKYINHFLVIQSAIFKRYGTNIIDWVKQNPEDLWESNNITHVDAVGFEFSAKFSIRSVITTNFPVNYIRFNYSYIDMNKNSSEYISKYVLDFLQHNLSFTMEHNLYKKLKASWKFQYRKRNGTFIPYDQEAGGWLNPEEYKAVWLLDLRMFYQLKNIKLYVEGSNLLDLKYQDIENVSLPGRWLRVGLSINFNLK